MKGVTYDIVSDLMDLEEIARLFDMYRVFYHQESDIDGAKNFIESRIKEKSSIIIVARSQKGIVGFTQLYPSFSSVSMKALYTLNDLFVHPNARGGKLGEGLIKCAQKMAIDLGWKGLVLETAFDNPAQKLYERLGWIKDVDYFHYSWSV